MSAAFAQSAKLRGALSRRRAVAELGGQSQIRPAGSPGSDKWAFAYSAERFYHALVTSQAASLLAVVRFDSLHRFDQDGCFGLIHLVPVLAQRFLLALFRWAPVTGGSRPVVRPSFGLPHPRPEATQPLHCSSRRVRFLHTNNLFALHLISWLLTKDHSEAYFSCSPADDSTSPHCVRTTRLGLR